MWFWPSLHSVHTCLCVPHDDIHGTRQAPSWHLPRVLLHFDALPVHKHALVTHKVPGLAVAARGVGADDGLRVLELLLDVAYLGVCVHTSYCCSSTKAQFQMCMGARTCVSVCLCGRVCVYVCVQRSNYHALDTGRICAPQWSSPGIGKLPGRVLAALHWCV